MEDMKGEGIQVMSRHYVGHKGNQPKDEWVMSPLET